MDFTETPERGAPARAKRSPATWALAGFIILTNVAILGMAASNIVDQRAKTLAGSKQEAANLAHSLTQHASLTFHNADDILIGLAEQLEHGRPDRERLIALFKQQLDHSPQFSSFAVADARGDIIANYWQVGRSVVVNVADRDFFKYHSAISTDELYIGVPVKSRTTGDWIIPVSRRVNHADGTFAGVVIANINPNYFMQLYDGLDIGPHGAVILMKTSGRLLVRRPFIESYVGRDMANTVIFSHVRVSPTGTVDITSPNDGRTRFNSYETDIAFPIAVGVAREIAEVLAPWRQDAIRRLIEAGSMSVLITLLGAVVWHIYRRRERDAASLAQIHASLDTALTNMSCGLTMFDADGKLIVWNDRCIQLYGAPPELFREGVTVHELIAHRKQSGSPELDVDAYVATLRQNLSDHGGGVSLSNAPDGRTISVTTKATANGGWVAIHEDITERVEREKNIVDQAAALARTNMRFDAALSNMTQGLCLFDADKKLVVANRRICEIYDAPEDVFKPGTPLDVILQHTLPRITNMERTITEHVAEIPADPKQEVTLVDGRTILVERSTTPDGGWVAIHEDVTDQRRQEKIIFEKAAELAAINERFDAALSNMSQGISMFDQHKRLVVWNDRYVDMYRFPPALLRVGTPLDALAEDLVTRGMMKGHVGPSAVDLKIAAMNDLSANASRIEELADGRFILISRKPASGGGFIATHEDITERRRAEAEIVHLARHDVLTGLANRAEFNDRLDEASRRAKRYGSAITVMMIDLDRFKVVNDTLGHPAGDKLLIEVAQRLKASVRETDHVARLGGDEFAVIQDGGDAQHEGAISLALRIIHAITQPFDLDGQQANVGASIGIAMAPEHGVETEDLLKRADLALYAVKDSGRNDFRIFQSDLQDAADLQQTAESQLREAIARDEFEMLYQPVFDAATREMRGVEALVRWRHPTRGLIGPDQFIPLAESSGLIASLGDWVLQQACADATAWPDHIRVAVNVSPVQFKSGTLFDVVLCTLVETGLTPARLELEITENVLLKDQDAHLVNIRQLKNLGISIALDDFGTGYSSMSYLTIFPFDKIKIDKSFVQGAHHRRDCRAVIASALALSKGLGIVTTAEGVETEEQLAYMRDAGVDLVQGYLLGRPVTASQIAQNAAGLPQQDVA